MGMQRDYDADNNADASVSGVSPRTTAPRRRFAVAKEPLIDHSAGTTAGPRGARRLWSTARQWVLDSTFAPSRLSGRWRHPLVGYVLALVLLIAIILLEDYVVHIFPNLIFRSLPALLTLLIVALTWGAGPSLLAAIVSALMFDWLQVAPRFSVIPDSIDHAIGVSLFLIVSVAISVIASKTEHARRQSAKLASELGAVFEAMSDGVIVYGKEGAIARANTAARDLLDFDVHPEVTIWPTEERTAYFELLDEHGELIPQRQLPVSRLLSGETFTGPGTLDVSVRALDGHRFQASISGAPIRDAEGNVTGGVAIMRDITERYRLQQRTRKALESMLAMARVLVSPDVEVEIVEELATGRESSAAKRLAALTRDVLECQLVTIISWNPQTNAVNPVASVGLSADDERQWWADLSDTRLDRYLAPDDIAHLKAGDILYVDLAANPPDPAQHYWGYRKTIVIPMLLGDQVVGLLTLGLDDGREPYTGSELEMARATASLAAVVVERERLMRERAEAQANVLALREANRRMDDFLGVASHELRTPITVIKANIQMVSRKAARRAGAEPALVDPEAFKLMERQIERLDRLVSDLVDVSRIQGNRLELWLQPCDLVPIVQDVVDEQRHVTPGRTITLDLPAARPVPVVVDQGRIGQVVTNYVLNALKYSPEERPVGIAVQLENGTARVAVRDEGPGLPSEEQEHVWERFHRAPGVAVQSGSAIGLGLGLYISRSIVERHGGRVGVESAPGAGSTFWFTLPLEREPRESAQ